MAKSYKFTELYEQTVDKLTSSITDWKDYLNTACRNYNLPFTDSVLIYAQNPKAEAVLELESWNKRYGRRVRYGAKGIGVLDVNKYGQTIVKYYFDIVDTKEMADARPVPLWKMDRHYMAHVISALENSFSLKEIHNDLPSTILDTVDIITSQQRSNYTNSLHYNLEGSLLYGLDEATLERSLQSALIMSVSYMILTRCDLDPSIYLDDIDFSVISQFNTADTMTCLGCATSEITQQVLSVIRTTVLTCEKENVLKFDKENTLEYNVLNHTERSAEHNERNLPTKGELYDSQPGSESRETSEREVRTNETKVSEGEQKHPVSTTVNLTKTERSSNADSGSSDQSKGTDHEADDETREPKRRVKRERPDALGTEDEQYPTTSRGDDPKRSDLQLAKEQVAHNEPAFSLLNPTKKDVNEQINLFDLELNESSDIVIRPFEMPQPIVDIFLTKFIQEPKKKLEIIAHFQLNRSIEEKANFLKEIYRSDAKGIVINKKQVAAKWDGNGFSFAYGTSVTRSLKKQHLSWEAVASRIDDLLEQGMYMTQDESSQVRDLEFLNAAEMLVYMYMDISKDYPQYMPSLSSLERISYPDDIHLCNESLRNPEKYYAIFNELKIMKKDYETNRLIMRLRMHTPVSVYPLIENLYADHKQFDANLKYPDNLNYFITDDNIDSSITPKNSEGRLSVYSYFRNNDTTKNRIQFMKKRFGQSGYYGGSESYDTKSKGIRYSRGDSSDPYDEILISWNEIAQRISYLIQNDIFITPSDKSLIPSFEREKIAREIEHFFFDFTLSNIRPFKEATAFKNNFDSIVELIKNENNVLHILDLMSSAIDERGKDKEIEMDLLDVFLNVKSFYEGTFSLFNEKKNPIRKYGEENKETSPLKSLAKVLCAFSNSTDLLGFKDPEDEIDDLTIDEVLGILQDIEGKQEMIKSLNCYLHRNVGDNESTDDKTLAFINQAIMIREELTIHLAIQKGTDFKKINNFRQSRGYDKYKQPPIYNSGDFIFIEYDGENINGTIEIIDSEEIKISPYLPDDVYPSDEHISIETEKFHRLLEVDSRNAYIFTPGEDRYPPHVVEAIEKRNEINQWNASKDNDKNISHFVPESSIDVSLPNDIEIVEETVEVEEQHQDEKIVEPVRQETGRANQQNHDYHISDINLGKGGPKQKYKWNVSAIEALKKLENENSEYEASMLEQLKLSCYVGWGALSDAFDPLKKNWEKEYDELKTLLTEEEYKAARRSTLTAFYTPPLVIKSIYDCLANLGINQGKILEPACGTGNFIGMKPTDKKYQFHGVELDSISGRIAKQLYQSAHIEIKGYEDTDLQDNTFDAVIGNVPFAQISINDKRYATQKFALHDYFFAKSLDVVKPGGVIIFITSQYTMDKGSNKVRKYIAQRAELLGAIRLPDNAFTENAGTKVTSDIIVLKKRERVIEIEEDWMYLGEDKNQLTINQYYIDHPEMIIGEMTKVTSQYGHSIVCKAQEGKELSIELPKAIQLITNSTTPIVKERDKKISEVPIKNQTGIDDKRIEYTIPADPMVRNFSYCIIDNQVYYRENQIMIPYEASENVLNRIKGMVAIRDCTRLLIDYQVTDQPMEEIQIKQNELNETYDTFTKTYGLINSKNNERAFREDSSFCLLCSLEILNPDGTLKAKADMFHKRTINPEKEINQVSTASEALTVSMAEKGAIDFAFMSKISNLSEAEIKQKLKGVIYPNPARVNEEGQPTYETADEYLSGDVRSKLKIAEAYVEVDRELYTENVAALTRIQPEDLKAGDISVRLGTAWIPTAVYEQFIFELLDTPRYHRGDIEVVYAQATETWNITRKNCDNQNIKVYKTYGTKRMNAYHIIEKTLNLQSVKIFDIVIEDGKEKRVLNRKETAIAQDKQDSIMLKFSQWIWKDPDRREKLCSIYNTQFNAIRNRSYEGSHLKFSGMNATISLNDHQVNAVARCLYGGNTLLAHCVGAGKTFVMIAAAMEKRRLGLANKPLIVVPNNIVDAIARDFYLLYPNANILVATQKDFEKVNRKKFFSRIATGEWDSVIIAHSQITKIPMSIERQIKQIENEIETILTGIQALEVENDKHFTIKQMERTRAKLEEKLEKLHDRSQKDDVLNFEEMGIDLLIVDEADLFKNLSLYTKMQNVAGISQTSSQKASDLFLKTRYLDEITGNKGVIFATGTPVSNSMAEAYTMQRYLQYDTLERYGLASFDAWASTFGEVTTSLELTPEGTKFKLKTRFSKFYNLPEMMAMYREIADIQTAEMLDLPVPQAHYEVIKTKPTKEQVEMVTALGERADKIRDHLVKPYEDNMLLITSDGRKLALDQRIINELLPDEPTSKVNACINNVYRIWSSTADKKLTQLIFSDLSTPKTNGKFNLYDDIRNKLIDMGVPENEVMYIHTAKNDKQKQAVFDKVKTGDVRILIGSTSKMGAGTNVQNLLYALHDLDCPWRPRDLEQRSGRIIRRGNTNENVYVYRYITEGTFDAYLFQTLEKKQSYISQLFSDNSTIRSMEEIDDATLCFAEIKALATGDPRIAQRCNLELELNKLNILKTSFINQKFELEDLVLKKYPAALCNSEEVITNLKEDIKMRDTQPKIVADKFIGIELGGIQISDKQKAGNMLLELCRNHIKTETNTIGKYRCFELSIHFNGYSASYMMALKNQGSYELELGSDPYGNFTRMDNFIANLDKLLEEKVMERETIQRNFESAKAELSLPFEHEETLKEKGKEFAELTLALKLDEKDPQINEEDLEQEEKKKAKSRGMDR